VNRSLTTSHSSRNTVKLATILYPHLIELTPSMHKVRRVSLNVMITSLISDTRCSVIGLGRNITSKTTEKYPIKRSMRLCSHPHLQCEMGTIYVLIA